MKKSLMMTGLAAMMLSSGGCFTMLDGITGGHNTGFAITMDVVTSPIQLTAVACFGVGWGLVELGNGGEYLIDETVGLFKTTPMASKVDAQ